MNILVRKVVVNGVVKRAVFGIYDPSVSNIKASMLLQSQELFSHFSTTTDLKVSLEDDYPIIITEATSNLVDCTKVYEHIKGNLAKLGGTFTDEQKNMYIDKVESLVNNRDAAVVITEFTIADINSHKYLRLSAIAPFGISQLDPAVASTIMQHYATRDIAGSTKTLFQKTCTDKLFLRLPSQIEMEDEDLDFETLVPKREEVCNPYNNPIAYTSMYKKPGSGITPDMYPLIEGSMENNELPIQENEQEFYDTLLNWIKANIVAAFGDKALDTDVKNIILDSNTEQFLNAMLSVIYSWHWGHNPNVPSYMPEDKSDEFSSSDSANSSYVFSLNPGEENELHIPAFIPLQDYVKQAAMELGYPVYAEAIVKLCRWGTRKPSALYFDGFPYIFDLGKNITKAYAGKISDYVLAEDENGMNMFLNCAIMCNAHIIDTKYTVEHGYTYNSLPVPVGLGFTQIYTHKNDPAKKLKMNVYVSMIDFVRNLFMQNNGNFKGLQNFKPKGFSVTEDGIILAPEQLPTLESIGTLRARYHNERSTALANPFYKNEVLEDLCIDLKVNTQNDDVEIDHFSVIDNGIQTADLESMFKDNAFSNLNELAEKFASCIISSKESAIKINIFNILLPILLEVNKNVAGSDKMTLPEILNAYKDAMLKYNYSDESAFLATRNTGTKSFSEISGLAATVTADVKPMQSFTPEEPEKKVTTVEEEYVRTQRKNLVVKIGELQEVSKVVCGDSNTVVGYVYLSREIINGKKKTKLILLDNEYLEKHPGTITRSIIQFRQLIAFTLDNLLRYYNGSSNFSIGVESNECLNYYVELYTKLIKEKKVV